jgi:hypothetical protein
MAKNKHKGSKNGKKKKGSDSAEETEKFGAPNKSNDNPWFLQVASFLVAVIVGAFAFVSSYSPWTENLSEDPMSLCGLVMANSSLPNSGWGMFVLQTIEEGHPVSFGDPIIQIPDIPTEQASAIGHLLHNYLWQSDVTGGTREGRVVYSFAPGTGSLANGHPTQSNIQPSNGALVDHAGVERSASPAAGAFTHYHDFVFHAHGKSLVPGDEIVVNYGQGWQNKISHDDMGAAHRSVSSLRRDGLCLDHIQPSVLTVSDTGRGAFSTRFLPAGTVVAPLPLIPLHRDALRMKKEKQTQLLLNYCYGHPQSSLLLLPYAPVVNLINHGHGKRANVKMRWSESTLHTGKLLLEEGLEEVWRNPNGLLMELVALRDIEHGEEILLDYGDFWQAAWDDHVKNWKPATEPYVYATHYNEEIEFLPTYRQANYPPNIRTTCFYKYNPEATSPFVWSFENGVTHYSNLYPCHILERDEERNVYTVLIQNQESPLLRHDEIPPQHVVEQVPRAAILLDDVPQSTDQHLESAFRHEIQIPDAIFPRGWRDLE